MSGACVIYVCVVKPPALTRFKEAETRCSRFTEVTSNKGHLIIEFGSNYALNTKNIYTLEVPGAVRSTTNIVLWL